MREKSRRSKKSHALSQQKPILSAQQKAPSETTHLNVMATSVTAKPPTQLFDLPQELLDQIFELAYPTEDNLKVASKFQWAEEQKRVRKVQGNAFVPTPFVHKVNGWMVSKRFFRTAAKAWIHAQEFGDTKSEDLYRPSEALFGSRLFFDYARNASVKWLHAFTSMLWFGSLPKFRQLKTLTLVMNDETFDAIEDKLAWTSDFSDDELQVVARANGMVLQPGSSLQNLNLLSPPQSIYIKSQSEWSTFAINLKRLERLVLDRKIASRVRNAVEDFERGPELEQREEKHGEEPHEVRKIMNKMAKKINANMEEKHVGTKKRKIEDETIKPTVKVMVKETIVEKIVEKTRTAIQIRRYPTTKYPVRARVVHKAVAKSARTREVPDFPHSKIDSGTYTAKTFQPWCLVRKYAGTKRSIEAVSTPELMAKAKKRRLNAPWPVSRDALKGDFTFVFSYDHGYALDLSRRCSHNITQTPSKPSAANQLALGWTVAEFKCARLATVAMTVDIIAGFMIISLLVFLGMQRNDALTY